MSLRSAVAGVLLSVPVVVTFLDDVGYPAPIEGHSMRVGPPDAKFGGPTC